MGTSSKTNNSDYEDLSVALLNINGLRNKTHEIRHIIAHHKLHVLALCETKLDNTVKDSEVYLPGVRMWRRDRDRYGGGVALYIQDHVETKLRLDLMKTTAEIIWVEVKLPDSRPVLLGCCYRRPNDAEDLNNIYEIMTLASKEKEDRDILLMGDFNIDWNLNSKKKIHTKHEETVADLGLKQMVGDFTRMTKISETCLDHIYTNIPELCSNPESMITGCSDHNLVTIKVRRKIPKRIRTFRSNCFIEDEFRGSIEEALWTNVSHEEDPKKALSKFTEIFSIIANKHAPLQTQDVYALLRLDEKMETLISERDQEKEDFIKVNQCDKKESSTSAGDKATHKTQSIKPLKSKQSRDLEQQLEKAKRDPTQLFKVYEKHLGRSLPSLVTNVTQDGDVASDSDHVENRQLNTGTTDLVSKASQFQRIKHMKSDGFTFGKIRTKIVKRSLILVCDHVIHLIDQTEVELIKLAVDHISAPITHILNRCLIGELPEELTVIQTFSTSSNKSIYFRQSNGFDRLYIMLSYVLDIILYSQAKKFFIKNKLITSENLKKEYEQLKTDWLKAEEANKTVGAVFLDFVSFFKTIRHDLLIEKLSSSGFSASALSLVKSFLSCSKGSCGLSQGSLLAELLFIICVNDLKTVLKKSSAISCDSYLMVIYSDGDPQSVEVELDDEIKSVRRWVKKFNNSVDETRPEPTKPSEMLNIFKILDSRFSYHGDLLDWIRALRTLVLNRGFWKKDEILRELEGVFGKRNIDGFTGPHMENLMNLLLLSRPELINRS